MNLRQFVFAAVCWLLCNLMPGSLHGQVIQAEPDRQVEPKKSDEAPLAEQALPWTAAFQPLSNRPAQDLSLVVITSDDPFQNAGNETSGRKFWFGDSIDQAVRELFAQRKDLRKRLELQIMAAGLPSEVTGGKPNPMPPQVLVALCNDEFRLLSFLVGVPEKEHLIQLVEDGEAVETTLKVGDRNADAVKSSLVKERMERVPRLWQDLIRELGAMNLGATNNEHADELQGSLAGLDQQGVQQKIRILFNAVEPTFMKDANARFGMSGKNAQIRLAALQQHPQTRQEWCDAMIPFSAGSDFRSAWRPLCEMLWGFPPVTNQTDLDPLLGWMDQQDQQQAFILGVTPPLSQSLRPWPPESDKTVKKRRGVTWHDVQSQALDHPFRQADAAQVARLIRVRELKPVDLYQPSLARYLYFPARDKTPLVVRETDLPSRIIGVLKRSNPKLAR